jgi:hypothetical protein
MMERASTRPEPLTETADLLARPVGILAAPRDEVALADGTVVRAAPGGTTIEVCRADGTSLFRYDAGLGRGRITLENESLELASRGDLRLRAGRRVEVEGQAVKLAAEELEASARLTRLRSDEARVALGRGVVEAARLETTAEVVLQTARNFYQQVQELAQQEAGNLRTLVAGTVQLKARQVFQRAAEAYRVRAEKINLG